MSMARRLYVDRIGKWPRDRRECRLPDGTVLRTKEGRLPASPPNELDDVEAVQGLIQDEMSTGAADRIMGYFSRGQTDSEGAPR
jgi:hypothetical protein